MSARVACVSRAKTVLIASLAGTASEWRPRRLAGEPAWCSPRCQQHIWRLHTLLRLVQRRRSTSSPPRCPAPPSYTACELHVRDISFAVRLAVDFRHCQLQGTYSETSSPSSTDSFEIRHRPMVCHVSIHALYRPCILLAVLQASRIQPPASEAWPQPPWQDFCISALCM